MKKDYLLTIIVSIITGFLVFIVTRDFFLNFAAEYKLIGGFIKFFFLATAGDFIGLRIKTKKWDVPSNILLKAVVWGFIGVTIVLMFTVFPIGVQALQDLNVLPFNGNVFFFALFTSILMNFTYAPTMMIFHRISDTYLNLKAQNSKSTISEAIESINFKHFINFTVFKTIPLFWVPAHTITFLIPEEYRVIFAAILGIVLGVLLGLFSNKK